MTEHTSKLARIAWVLGMAFVAVVIVWVLSIMGAVPLTFRYAMTPAELEKFLDSPRDDMRGIKVNGHFLDIGKRRSLQILKGYDEIMYLVRPHRNVRVQPRNLTRPEVLDFCTNITGPGFQELRSRVESGTPPSAEWEGTIGGRPLRIVKASMFGYFITGLHDTPIFMTQVELARRLGMDEALILSRLIPVQKRWYEEFTSSGSQDTRYPLQYIIPMGDELTNWLNEQASL
ncbi:MAG: hypothetical protein WAR22_03955 [Desulfomonilia bacterium]|jgi:hypothetical protein